MCTDITRADRWPWSCDSFVILPAATTDGSMLLGKNSDRPVNETQPLRYLPARAPTRGERLELAYVDLADDRETLAHVGASPYWCWGHELGLNERGVAIGNEALFTRDLAANQEAARAGASPEPGILGMELLRLGLERGRTAAEAMEVMTALLERHGQWGAGTAGKTPADGAYDNSYVIADGREAWVLETSGRSWVAAEVHDSSWSVSNQATIRTDWDRAGADVVNHARDSGWWDGERGRFDFAEAYTDPQVPLQVSHIRLQRSRQLRPYFNASRPDFLTLCMHSHPSGFTWGNTASSAVFVLPPDNRPPHLWWAAATPCTSVYVPVFVRPLPEVLERAGSARPTSSNPERAPEDSSAADSYWWTFQRLLDAVKGDELGTTFACRQPHVRETFDELEAAMRAELDDVLAGAAPEAFAALTQRSVDRALDAANALLGQFSAAA